MASPPGYGDSRLAREERTPWRNLFCLLLGSFAAWTGENRRFEPGAEKERRELAGCRRPLADRTDEGIGLMGAVKA